MSTKRQTIREAVTSLLSGNTLCGTNVYSNRVAAYWRTELPSISIFIRNETATKRGLSGNAYIRNAELAIEVHCEATENLDNSLDTIAEQVESILESNDSLNGTVQGLVLQDTEIEIIGDSTTPVGVLTLVYQITYLK